MFLFLFIGIKYTKDPVYSCELSPPLPDDASSDHTSLIIPVSGGVQVPNFTPGAGQPAATAAFLPAATPPPALPLLTTAAADIEPFVHLVTAPTVAVEHPETAGAVVGNRDTAERRQFNEDVLPVPIDPRRRQYSPLVRQGAMSLLPVVPGLPLAPPTPQTVSALARVSGFASWRSPALPLWLPQDSPAGSL